MARGVLEGDVPDEIKNAVSAARGAGRNEDPVGGLGPVSVDRNRDGDDSEAARESGGTRQSEGDGKDESDAAGHEGGDGGAGAGPVRGGDGDSASDGQPRPAPPAPPAEAPPAEGPGARRRGQQGGLVLGGGDDSFPTF